MKSPPSWLKKLLRAISPEAFYEQIEGDLMELYHHDLKTVGRRKARFNFLISSLRFLRPGIVLRNKFSIQIINIIMLRNYFKISLRNIKQSPLYSFINMFSLTVGIASCIIIYLFISDELSFDSFHSNKAAIYRVCGVPHYSGNGNQKIALTNGWTGPAMAEDFPQVANFTRYWSQGKTSFKNGEAQFLINNVVAVDSTFLDIFDFELQFGNRATALDEPNSVVLTEETALKFFKNANESVGKAVTVQNTECKITGVLKNIPENSHLRFDALLPISALAQNNRMFNSDWEGSFLNTYLQLQTNVDKKELESKFPDFWARHTGITDRHKGTTLLLQPLSDIHLGSSNIDHDYNNYRKFNATYIKVFGITGFFVLLIACVNFMNLTTARALYRWKEIGIRKSVGARKSQLFGQFIFESALLAIFALALALLVDIFFLPYLNQLFGRHLELSALIAYPIQFGLLVVATLFLGLLTGIYPSFYMTSFNVSHVLKGGNRIHGKSIFQSSLVVLQFGLAIGLIISTLVVLQQLYFMKNTDIGFTKDQIMLVAMNREANEKLQVLRTELMQSQYVKGVTASSQRLGNNLNGWGFKVKTDTGVYNFVPSNLNVDFDYLKVYGIKILEGRDFSRDFLTDNGMAFLINETMARELNMKEPIGTPAGQSWYEDNSLGSIIGVVKDFNYNSLYTKIGMLAIVCKPEWGYDEVSIKIDGANAQEAIAAIKEVWDKNISTYPFAYSFLDEHFNNLYRSDQQVSSVISITAILAIVISCIGLFGLVTITTNKKVKEIGVRKLLGATNIQISSMLSSSFAKLILVSFILICPITYYILLKWLENFSYRISISPWTFFAGGFSAIIIAMLTISYHTIKSARENPVNSLRYE
ncbi:MAG: ABC transporter permease [Bacteroidetes bacterium]|nr:ABC transporter permease [Bacteroidota bacterium]